MSTRIRKALGKLTFKKHSCTLSEKISSCLEDDSEADFFQGSKYVWFGKIADANFRLFFIKKPKVIITKQVIEISEVLQKDKSLPVVLGESGSGKTIAMLAQLPQWNEKNPHIGVYLKEIDWKLPENDDRNDAFVDKVCRKVSRALGRKVEEDVLEFAAKQKPYIKQMQMNLVLVFDEMSQGDALAALCATKNDIAKFLNKSFGFTKVSIIAGGTGRHPQERAPGSEMKSYQVVEMVPDDSIFNSLIECLNSSWQQAIQASPLVNRLKGNPRLAALIVKEVLELQTSHGERSSSDLIAGACSRAMQQYKEVNGCKSIVPEAIPEILRCVLRATLFEDTSKARIKHLQHHIITHGLLTDSIRWCLKGEAVGNEFKVIKYIIEESGELKTVWAKDLPKDAKINIKFKGYIPATQRTQYKLSTAQMQILRWNFGYSELRSDWSSLETVSALYFECLLIACYQRPLQDLLLVLGVPAQQIATLEAPLNYKKVKIRQIHTRIEPSVTQEKIKLPRSTVETAAQPTDAVPPAPQTLIHDNVEEVEEVEDDSPCSDEVEALLTEIKTELDQENAVIVVNAGQAAFADVLVFIPKVAVFCIQSKFYQVSSFNYCHALQELFKMGFKATSAGGRDLTAAATVAKYAEIKDKKKLQKAPNHWRQALFQYYCANAIPKEFDICSGYAELLKFMLQSCEINHAIPVFVTTTKSIEELESICTFLSSYDNTTNPFSPLPIDFPAFEEVAPINTSYDFAPNLEDNECSEV